jgi:hypothetical protein
VESVKIENLLIKSLFLTCIIFSPFIFTKSKFKELLIVFFSKGVLSIVLDTYVVNSNRVQYPIRPFPKIFSTNILFDLLFFPMLSILWVRQSYHDSLPQILLKSLTWSVPMSLLQWFMEKSTNLFKWKKWSIFHTFSSVSFTLLSIRALVGIIKKIFPEESVSEQHVID